MGITESMSGMAMGSKRPGGITGAMEHKGMGMPKPEHEHDDVASHLKAMHEKMGGKHMHVHQDEGGNMTTHHVGEDGKVEGPHDHENMEALKDHMGKFLDEEEHEPSDSDDDDGLM